ncbi:phage tail tape measure protein [Escherichia coli]|nr:phage tail tape measure protein [Escherichia coli]MGA38749.1 phage tail tape measure protein [Escherichia coli]
MIMSLLNDVQKFIEAHPGCTSGDIADAFAGYSRQRVLQSASKLRQSGRVAHRCEGDTHRHFPRLTERAQDPEPQPVRETRPVRNFYVGTNDPRVILCLTRQAEELESRGLYRRAATVWMAAFRESHSQPERNNFLARRERCLRKSSKLNFKSFTSSVLSDMAKILAQATMMKSIKGIGSVLGFDLSSLSLNANGGIYQSADLSRYSGTVVNRPTFFAFAKGAGVMGEAGPEAILPLRRGADGKLGVVADIGGSGMAMFAPQYNIEINNDGTNGQIGPAALKVVYDLGKKAAADFMQQQARDGGRLSGAYR